MTRPIPIVLLTAALSLPMAAQAQMGPPNYDADHDGKVTLAEFRGGQADAMLRRLDKDHDGKISREEFRVMEARVQQFGGAEGVARVAAMWSQGDANRDGFLSRAELEIGATRRFRTGDTNNDGWLSKGEILSLRQARDRAGG